MSDAASHPVSLATAAIPPALARAWQAVSLYGLDHPATRTRLADAVTALSGLEGALRLVVETRGLSLDGQPLEPAVMYASLGEALHRAGIFALDLLRPLDAPTLAAVMQALVTSRQSDADAAAAISQASNGAVAAHRLSAQNLALGRHDGHSAAPVTTRGLVNSELSARAAGLRGESLPVVGLARDADPADFDAGSQAKGNLTHIREAVDGLGVEQRRDLLDLLGHSEGLDFDRAVGVLSMMPAEDLVHGLHVLQRPDARVSRTALLLLRRMAQLSLGREQELKDLARTAESWAAAPTSGPFSPLAGVAARLLDRLSETEFRAADYSGLLEELVKLGDSEGRSVAGPPPAETICRAVEAVLGSLAQAAPTEVPELIRFLHDRLEPVAKAGRLALFLAMLDAASQFLAEGDDLSRLAAQMMLDDPHREAWLAQAMSDGAAEAELSRVVTREGTRAGSLLVRASILARSDDQRRRLAEAAHALDEASLRAAILAESATDATLPLRVPQLLAVLSAPAALTCLRACLTSSDAGHRREAIVALIELNTPLPADLIVRVVMDPDVSVRLLGIRAASRQPGAHTDTLLDRLAGKLGIANVTPEEAVALAKALRPAQPGDGATGQSVARHVARHPARLAVIPDPKASPEALALLAAGCPQTFSIRAARALWRCVGVSTGALPDAA